MPRKAAAAPATDTPSEPRRSSRIKEQPRADPPKKAPKPRAKKAKPAEAKADETTADVKTEPKPKSARGRKRPAADKDAEAGDAAVPDDAEKPPSKKVRPSYESQLNRICNGHLSVLIVVKTRLHDCNQASFQCCCCETVTPARWCS